MIDYWKIDDNFRQNSLDDFRGNQIFYNINNKLAEIESGKRIVILFGDSHFYYQNPIIKMTESTKNTISKKIFKRKLILLIMKFLKYQRTMLQVQNYLRKFQM